MGEGRAPLTDIAVATSFASQSNFSRTSIRMIGSSPRAWLRSVEAQ